MAFVLPVSRIWLWLVETRRLRQFIEVQLLRDLCNKKSRSSDFDPDEFKVTETKVRYKHLTQITIKVQLFLTFTI